MSLFPFIAVLDGTFDCYADFFTSESEADGEVTTFCPRMTEP